MVEELTAVFRVCKHIKHDGNRCNSPAMTGMNFCFHHIGGKVASLVREGATYDASAQLDFPYPADRESIQQSLHLVAQALREGKIDTKTANTYIRIFRLEEQNFHRWEKKQKNTEKNQILPKSDVIPSEREEPAVSTPAAHTQPTATEAIPNADVILSEREAQVEEPAFPPPAPPTQPNKEPSVLSVSSCGEFFTSTPEWGTSHPQHRCR